MEENIVELDGEQYDLNDATDKYWYEKKLKMKEVEAEVSNDIKELDMKQNSVIDKIIEEQNNKNNNNTQSSQQAQSTDGLMECFKEFI